jgi:hypothetical protein
MMENQLVPGMAPSNFVLLGLHPKSPGPAGTRRPQYLDWSRIAFFLREDAIPELRARLDSRHRGDQP